jgi:hypothetical protein
LSFGNSIFQFALALLDAASVRFSIQHRLRWDEFFHDCLL